MSRGVSRLSNPGDYTNVSVSIARYMERLDNFIESQNQMNKQLISMNEDLSKKVEGLAEWRDKISGGKILLGGIIFLIVNAAVIWGLVKGFTN